MAATQESVSPPRGDAKRVYVRDMFTAIAPRYDFLNHLLSLNIDRRWRRRAIDRLNWHSAPDGQYLDLCAGTLDLAAELATRSGFRGSVVGADFVVPMLRRGVGKAVGVSAVGADALELPFADDHFDGCTVGFGARNLADLDRGLLEMGRVLKPGARLVLLEFTTPTRWPIRPLYLWYFQRVLPLIGRMVSKHKDAYSYLPDSVIGFPSPPDLRSRFEAAGFSAVGWKSLTFGVACLHWGTRR